MPNLKAVFLICGKRKSGKDYVSVILREIINTEFGETTIRRISDSLKEEYALKKELNSAEELKTDGPLKEVYRKEMILFGEKKRAKDSGYFCRQAIANLPETTRYLIITDCRRPTDLVFFKNNFKKVFVIPVIADLETRALRGFCFTTGIDDAESECALDDYSSPDATIDNSGTDIDVLKNFIRHVVYTLLK